MATSGTSDFSQNRNELIKAAFRKSGILAMGEEPEPEMINNAADELNRMVKAWMADGAHLWAYGEIVVFLDNAKQQYSLGPTGDHATLSYNTTDFSVAALVDATTISVTSITGIAAGDNIGMVLDSGALQWTTVSQLGAATVYTENFNDSAGLTFDSAKIEITGGAAALKSPFSTDNPTVTIDQAITGDIKGWNSFIATETISGSDNIKYILSDDDGTTYKYWNGASWSTSDGTYSQSNTETEVNANVGTFPITSSGMKIRLFLHSDAGITTPSIDNLDVNYGIGDSLVIATGLTGAASIGNNVYTYTTKATRPLKVFNGRTQINDANEIPILAISRSTYFQLPTKSTTGIPTQFYYNPTLVNGTLYLWPTSSTSNNIFLASVELPLEDFDNITDDPYFPQEWQQAIVYNLAYGIGFEYGIDEVLMDRIERIAQKEYLRALAFDQENNSIRFNPAYEEIEGWA